MTNKFPTVAVLGAGQLARMMQSAAVELGVNLQVLANSMDEPAAQVCPRTVIGKLDERAALEKVIKGAQVLTFEHELIPPQTMEWLSQRIEVRPGPSALLYAQNKVRMRQKLSELGEPIPNWAEIRDTQSLQELCQTHHWPLVGKVAHGGYDGRGVTLLESPEKLEQWIEECGQREALVEERIDFTAELAVLGARRPGGECKFWPVVETRQIEGQCAQVIAPAAFLNEEIAQRATDIGARIAQELEITGVFAVEMFLDAHGELFINELAMRPHNSGHWTQDGSVTSQFEQHLRAVLDMPLAHTAALSEVTVMVNILGSLLENPAQESAQVMAEHPRVKLHFYGKDNRPRRKLGHVNLLGENPDITLEEAMAAANKLMYGQGRC